MCLYTMHCDYDANSICVYPWRRIRRRWKKVREKINRKNLRRENCYRHLAFRVFFHFPQCRLPNLTTTRWWSKERTITIVCFKTWHSNNFIVSRAAVYNRLYTSWKWFIWLSIVKRCCRWKILLRSVCSLRCCRRRCRLFHWFWILLNE